MDITVVLVPPTPTQPPTADAPSDGLRVSLVVDVLRSATTAAVLFDRGVGALSLTDGLRVARQVAAQETALLIGERDGMPPEGFNLGNSPAALRRARLAGESAVLLAAESPRALAFAAGRGPTALVGLTNVVVAAERVCALEPQHVDVVCAGLAGAPDLADVMAAGLLVSLLARNAPRAGNQRVTLHGAAHFCLSVLRMTSDPLDGLWVSESGATLRGAGYEEDLAIASAVGSSDTLPWVTGVEIVSRRRVVRLARTLAT
jgi:2-phosphosulfolactate phosphatase